MPLQTSSVSVDAVSNSTKIWAFILGPVLAILVYFLLPDSFVGIMFGSLLLSVLAAGVGVYLTPYLNLSICRFYLLATAPQVNEPPHFDSWNDNF